METSPPSPTPSIAPSDTRWWVLPATAVIGVAAIIIIVVLLSISSTTDDGGDRSGGAADTGVPATAGAPTSTEAGTVPPPSDTSISDTSAATPTTSTTPSSTVATTTTETPAPTTTGSETVPAPTFTTDVLYGDGSSATLDLAGTQSGLTVYDGLLETPPLRCVALFAPTIDGWNEWCGESNTAARFLTSDGSTTWLVELGADVGVVTVSVPPRDWTLTAHGCSDPVADLVDAAIPGPSVLTGAVCVPGEAFVTISTVLLQPGSPDGGGTLVTQASDGTWTAQGGGTSFPCDDANADGIDRCPAYGLDDGNELFSAVLPVPPIGGASATADVVGIRDATVDVRAVIGAATSSSDISAAVAAAFRDGTEEPAPAVDVYGGFGAWNMELVIVVVPAFDDSILSTTYAVWVAPDPVVRAFAFETCARGLAGGGLCI